MSAGPPQRPGDPRGHYSYAHYANRDVAEGFDALRFGGAVGRYLMDWQERLLVEVLSPLEGRRILDVGTGTGRAALALAARGARVEGLDASAEMLQVARSRAAEARVSIAFGVADAQHLPIGDREVDAAVCLRLLMHVVDWPQCVAELCRVARHRVVVDFPAACSAAALESLGRRVRHAIGGRTEAYRVIRERDVARAFASHGFRVVARRRQFVLPIALHKRLNRLPVSLALERGLAAIGALRVLGSPVTMVAER
jgi:ubiquinone/menaquinone biosynthesis C-methylase UbiE